MSQNLAPTTYLETRLATFEALAERAMSASWSRFWQSQAETIREELKLKMVNPAVRPAGGET